MTSLKILTKKNEINKLEENIQNIKNIYIVMSGKGGVGKSTISSMIASGLLLRNYKVGILDCDFHGPSIPFLFGLKDNITLSVTENGKLIPILIKENLKLMSISFLLENNDQPIIWRAPMKTSALKQFLEDVEWGELDYLIIDLPPGTGDEILNIVQTIKNIDGAIVVTIPQDVALLSVRKSLSFLKKINIHLVGIISNMDGFICPKCNEKIDIFSSKKMNNTLLDYNTKIIAKIQMNIDLSRYEENGEILSFMKEKNLITKEIDFILDIFDKKFNK